MNKRYYEAKLEGRCDNCDRDPILCEEEGECLSQKKFYELVVQFERHSIRLETDEESEYNTLTEKLDYAIKEKEPCVKLGNYVLCTNHILYYRTEEYYG